MWQHRADPPNLAHGIKLAKFFPSYESGGLCSLLCSLRINEMRAIRVSSATEINSREQPGPEMSGLVLGRIFTRSGPDPEGAVAQVSAGIPHHTQVQRSWSLSLA